MTVRYVNKTMEKVNEDAILLGDVGEVYAAEAVRSTGRTDQRSDLH